MMEENNEIFVAGCDALVYLAEPVHKKYLTTFVWDHPLSSSISYDRFFDPLPLYAPVYLLDDLRPFHSPQFLQLRICLMDGLFLNHKNK